MRHSFPFFLWLSVCVLLAGCARPKLKDSLADLQAPEGSPMLLAVYQPWFGSRDHIDVGYSSHDPEVLRSQISRAKGMNIGGFVVNWYGPHKEFEDRTFALLEETASEGSFKIAAQYDEAVDHPGDTTDAVIADLQYLNDRYVGKESYLRYHGRPVVFIFPKGSGTDWNRVRQATQSWADPPLLIYKDGNATYNDAFDGYYAWVQPGRGGWARDGRNYGEDYLDYFYKNMIDHHPNKLAIGAVWPGFNDSKASWGRNRRIAYRCGKTFAETLRVFRHYYGMQNPPPYLLIVTWNDYEEGTDIERGISHCGPDRGRNIDTARAGQP